MPDDEKIVESEQITPEVIETATEPESTPIIDAPIIDSELERIKEENEAYRQHFEALNSDISNIREKYKSSENKEPPDPVNELRNEVKEIKGGFAQLMDMLKNGQQQQQPAQNQQQFQQPQYQQQQQQPYNQFQQPYFPQQQFQAPQIFIAPPPPLPYYQSPMIQPIMPTVGNGFKQAAQNQNIGKR